MNKVISITESLREARPDNASTVGIIVPVFNEESILESQLVPVLKILPAGFRITIVENGSTDRTEELLHDLEERYTALDSISLPLPNYGLAMKTGLIKSQADIVIIDDLDVLDTDFWIRGLRLLCKDDIDLVQGSKVLAGKNDRRPLIRKAATLALTFLLRSFLGYSGTDTHGPKVVWRDAIKDIPPRCEYELDIFPTELVIRAQKSGIRIREIPIHLREIRATPLPLIKRVPRALRDIWRLHRSLYRGGRG
ncbi:MAG: glycosyltransferase [Candidatus Aegiribacteria sp.]|nr:glycosyltransferase [Candidatus Aegiribacteria sp.]